MPVSARSVVLLLLFILLMPIVLILVALGIIPLTPPIILLLSLSFFVPIGYLLRMLVEISEDTLRMAGYSLGSRAMVIYIPTAFFFASLTIQDINQYAAEVFNNPALVVTIAFTLAMVNVIRLLLCFFHDAREPLPLFARGAHLASLSLTTFALLVYNLFLFASIAIAWAPYTFSYALTLNSPRFFLDMLALALLPWMMGLRILPMATTADITCIVVASVLHFSFFIMLLAGLLQQRQPGALRVKGVRPRRRLHSLPERDDNLAAQSLREGSRTDSENASTTTSK